MLSKGGRGRTQHNAVFKTCLGLLPMFLFLVPNVVTFTLRRGCLKAKKRNFLPVLTGKGTGTSTTFPALMTGLLPTKIGNLIIYNVLTTLVDSLTSLFGSSTVLFAVSFCGHFGPGASRGGLMKVKRVTAITVIVLNVL